MDKVNRLEEERYVYTTDIQKLKNNPILHKDLNTVKKYIKKLRLKFVFIDMPVCLLLNALILYLMFGEFEEDANISFLAILILILIDFCVCWLSIRDLKIAFTLNGYNFTKCEYGTVIGSHIEERKVGKTSDGHNQIRTCYFLTVETQSEEIIKDIECSKKLYKKTENGDRILVIVYTNHIINVIGLNQDI